MICWIRLFKRFLACGGILLLSIFAVLAYAQQSFISGPQALESLAKTYSEHKGQEEAQQQLKLTTAQPTVNQESGVDNAALNSSDAQYDPEHLFPKPSVYEKEAFQDVTRQAMPMTPDQIVQMHKMLDVTQRASAVPVGVPPKPTLSTQEVNLAPGSVPPVIRLQQGFVTSIVFVDASGANWPIEAYNLGNPNAFNLQWQPGANTIMIQAVSRYTYGNLAVKLTGLATPVMLTLMPGQQDVDYRVDLRIPKLGPHTKPAVIADNLPPGANTVLLGILDGVPPDGAKKVNVMGGDCLAWVLGDKMYLRTRLTLLSPSWLAVMSSPDGTKAYEMAKNPVLLVSKYGRPIELKIEGL